MGCIKQKPSTNFNFVNAYAVQGVSLSQINDDLDYCTLNPPSPQNLVVTGVGPDYINLEWTSFSSGIDTGFEVYRSLTGFNGSWVKIATLLTDVTTYEDTGLDNDTEYFYKVRATGVIPSSFTNIVSVTTEANVIFEYYFEFNVEKDPFTDIMVIKRLSPVHVSAILKTDSSGEISFDSEIEQVSGGSTLATNLGEFVNAAGYTDVDGLGSAYDAKISSWIDIEGNFLLAQGEDSKKPLIVEAGIVKSYLDFNGTSDEMAGDIGIVLSRKVPDASGGDVGEGFTCTGLCLSTNDTFWMGNDGRNISGDVTYEPSLVNTSKDATSKIDEILLLPIYPSCESVQGVTEDTTDDTLFFASLNEGLIRQVTKAGVDVSSISKVQPNGLGYDTNNDTLWYSSADVSINQFVYEIDKSTGAVLTTLDLSSILGTGSNITDHLYVDPDDTHLWISYGSSGEIGNVVKILKSDGTAVIHYRFGQIESIEGIYVEGDDIYVLSDAYFHASESHAYSPKNKLFKYNSNKSPAIKATVVFATNAIVGSSTDCVFCVNDPVNDSSVPGALGLFTVNPTTLRAFINTGSDISTRQSFDFTVPNLMTMAEYAIYIDTVAATLELWREGVQIGVESLTYTLNEINLIGAVSIGQDLDANVNRSCPMNIKSLKIEKI